MCEGGEWSRCYTWTSESSRLKGFVQTMPISRGPHKRSNVLVPKRATHKSQTHAHTKKGKDDLPLGNGFIRKYRKDKTGPVSIQKPQVSNAHG